MKILLVGGTGTLSSDIRRLALDKKNEVYILNRGRNIQKLEKNLNIIIADIRNVKEVKEKISDLYFDVVVDFLSYTKRHLEKTLEIFNNKTKQFVFISSATVYSKLNSKEKIVETTKLVNKEWDYARDKIECEEYLELNYKTNNQKYTIVRPYVTYGLTRIPFAIIPDRKQWTLANRILIGKPIVLWDNGEAVCTLTNTKDFAKGMLGLFGNEKAYNQAFHITSDENLNWNQALIDIGNALNKKPLVADIPTDYIIKYRKELKGVLKGDKGIDRIFDNTKIKGAVPEFNCTIKFKDGIKETIENYKNNFRLQEIDYIWDGRIDNLILKYYRKKSIKFKKIVLTTKLYKKLKFSEKIKYYIGRYSAIYLLYNSVFVLKENSKKVIKKLF